MMKLFSITHKSAGNRYKEETVQINAISPELAKKQMRSGLSGPIAISQIFEVK